jgi:hypothetical protein
MSVRFRNLRDKLSRAVFLTAALIAVAVTLVGGMPAGATDRSGGQRVIPAAPAIAQNHASQDGGGGQGGGGGGQGGGGDGGQAGGGQGGGGPGGGGGQGGGGGGGDQGGGGQGGGGQGAGQGGYGGGAPARANDDPWAADAASDNGFSDEPPF